jgi:hypothetical protein
LVLFDRRRERSWEEKLYRLVKADAKGREIAVWGA